MNTLACRKLMRVLAGLLTLAQASCQACDPWPEPQASAAPAIEYLVAVPNELEIHIDDPSTTTQVWVVGKVYDEFHNPVVGEHLQFSITPAGMGLDHYDVGPDRTKLIVKPTTGTPADKEFTVKVEHAATMKSLSIPVHVRYSATLNGVQVPVASATEWPMAGLASGEADGAWRSNVLIAFVRRARMDAFEGTGVPPLGDLASGTVLSPANAVWREEKPWATSTTDVVNTTSPATITLHPVVLSDNAPGTGGVLPSEQLVKDLQGGADIIETSLLGARVEIKAVEFPPGDPRVSWDINCKAIADKLKSLPPEFQPDVSRLMVYMVDRSPAPPSNQPMECDPTKWPAAYPNEHAIFLPVGIVEAQSVAHEIGHALALTHVSWNGGFFHSNLMVEATTGMGALRDRFSVGQAFHGALDGRSWLVLAGQNKSLKLDCEPMNPQCPKLPDDILKRSPP